MQQTGCKKQQPFTTEGRVRNATLSNTESDILSKSLFNMSENSRLWAATHDSLINEICILLGYYAALCGNCLPTFQDTFKGQAGQEEKKAGKTVHRLYRGRWLSSRLQSSSNRPHLLLHINIRIYRTPSFHLSFSSWTSWPFKMGPIRCPETSVKSYHTTIRNIPEEHRSHQHGGWSLKSLIRVWTGMSLNEIATGARISRNL
jgi:hypothetical protein